MSGFGLISGEIDRYGGVESRLRVLFLLGALLSALLVAPATAASAGPCPGGNCIPYTTWAACGLFSSKNKQVTAPMTRKKVSGRQEGRVVTLRCGTKSYGYRHIKATHLTDWENKAALIRRNWRDLADWSMRWTLRDPDKVSWRDSNQTWCYSRKFKFTDGDTVLMTMVVRVVSGRTSQRLITSFPTTRSPCTGTNLL